MSQDKLTYLLRMLDVSTQEVERLWQLPHADALTQMNLLKDKVHKNWRKMALQLHPDRTNGDPEKTELFQELTQIKDFIEGFKLPEPVQNNGPVQAYSAIQVPMTPGVSFTSNHRVQRPRGTPRHTGYQTATMKP